LKRPVTLLSFGTEGGSPQHPYMKYPALIVDHVPSDSEYISNHYSNILFACEVNSPFY